jgi:hypothetical protein
MVQICLFTTTLEFIYETSTPVYGVIIFHPNNTPQPPSEAFGEYRTLRLSKSQNKVFTQRPLRKRQARKAL